MNVYSKIFGTGLKIELEYRFNLLFSFLFSSIPLFITILIWNAVYRSNNQFAENVGFTAIEMIGYLIFANIAFKLVETNNYEVSNEIRNGDLNKYLLKPFSYIRYKAINLLSKFTIKIVIYAIPILISMVVFKISILKIFLFAMAVLLALVLNYLLNLVLSFLTFWLLNISGIFALIQFVTSFLAGILVPLNLFPNWLRTLSEFLPFKYLGYAPSVLIFTDVGYKEVLSVFIGAVIWIVILWVLVKFLWKVGIKEYGAFGG
ncbi:MAG: ABC-2 family transporter protein [Halanaerobiales bacterium]|nr:ABC-2 family transporter protein [Halanaerobiales bacterium]